MRRVSCTLAGVAALALAVSAPAASAATLTGTFWPTPNSTQGALLPFNEGAGLYRVGFDLSRPAKSGALTVEWTFSWDTYDLVTGDSAGDDDLLYHTTVFGGRTHASEVFKLLPDYHIVVPGVEERYGRYHDAQVSLNALFDGSAPVNFRLFADRVGPIPEPIPEPTSWALLILGFAAAGAALRRRREATRPV